MYRPSSNSSIINAGTRASSIRPAQASPDVLTLVTGNLLGQAPEERVARDSFKEDSLDPLPGRMSCPSADRNTDQEEDHQYEEKGQGLLGREPVREEQGEWPHQTHDRFHSLEEQQNGEVDRNDNEQAANDRLRANDSAIFICPTFRAPD